MTGQALPEWQIVQEYVCDNCGAGNCKLWADYQEIRPVVCAPCAFAYANKTVVPLDARGTSETETGRTDQIGWLCPAIQILPGYSAQYTYHNVPPHRAEEWRALPTYPAAATKVNAD